jgi:hypothetical protein
VDQNSGTNNNTDCTNPGKDRHLFYDFGFDLPLLATIQGIAVQLEAKVDNTDNSPKMCVELSWNGGLDWTRPKATETLATTDATYILGDPGNLWERPWSAVELRNLSFRVRVTDVASTNHRDFSLDWIAVQVTYLNGQQQ